jgi:hypothetical protein
MGLYWRGLIHDWSKFLPNEWGSYANHFYGNKHRKYSSAWLSHIHRNKHHWEHWVIPQIDNKKKISYHVFKPLGHAVEMPDIFIKEMLCDWFGAARSQKADRSIFYWYQINKCGMILHPNTEKKILQYFSKFEWLHNEHREKT